jgi:hypothetical protein
MPDTSSTTVSPWNETSTMAGDAYFWNGDGLDLDLEDRPHWSEFRNDLRPILIFKNYFCGQCLYVSFQHTNTAF